MGRRCFKRGKKRNRSVKHQLQFAKITHYYSLLDGWKSNEDRLIFSTPSSALCYQLSRYYRDGLCYSPHKPSWLDCVGGLTLSDTDLKKSSIVSNSCIEKKYFNNAQVYSLSSTVGRVKTTIVRATQELFSSCKETLKEFPDYMSSSGSIYRLAAVNTPGNVEYVSNLEGFPLPRGVHNLVTIGVNSRAHFLNKSHSLSVDDVINDITLKVQNACIPEDNFVLVSICCGIPVTEMQSTSILCLCLDKDKRSLSSGVIVKKNGPKSRTILAEFNYKEGLKLLLNSLSEKCGKPIKVLLQHPSPSEKGFQELRQACSDIIKCMVTNNVSTLCFVYDSSSERKNCWSKSRIIATCIPPDCMMDNTFSFTDEKLISEKGDDKVMHPLFGPTSRYGWARMKKSNEYTFSIILRP